MKGLLDFTDKGRTKTSPTVASMYVSDKPDSCSVIWEKKYKHIHLYGGLNLPS